MCRASCPNTTSITLRPILVQYGAGQNRISRLADVCKDERHLGKTGGCSRLSWPATEMDLQPQRSPSIWVLKEEEGALGPEASGSFKIRVF